MPGPTPLRCSKSVRIATFKPLIIFKSIKIHLDIWRLQNNHEFEELNDGYRGDKSEVQKVHTHVLSSRIPKDRELLSSRKLIVKVERALQ